MHDDTDQVAVFRSMDPTAEDECEAVAERLEAAGISGVLVVDDSAMGVPEGVYEVRVPAASSAQAEALLAEKAAATDDSHDLDMETIFRSGGGTVNEVEAVSIHAVLEANGITAVLVGDAVLPNFGLEVRVARDDVARATAILEEARREGSAAADQAEREGEAANG